MFQLLFLIHTYNYTINIYRVKPLCVAQLYSTKSLITKIRHTLSPLSDFVSIMVRTVSYRMALPTFLLVSVFVATC